MTDSTGAIAETMDYYPFGGIRLDNKTGTFNEQRKYIGQEFDADTGLNYLNARYYNSGIGRFISQDPAFWNNSQLAVQLMDPQSWNSYTYSRNNPIILSDPGGKFWKEAFAFYQGAGNAYVSDNAFGFGRQSRSDAYFSAGQKLGDTAALIQGSYETAVGIATIIGGTGGSLILAPATLGGSIPVGLSISAVGVAGAIHGLGVTGTAGYYLSKSNGSENGLSNLNQQNSGSKASPNLENPSQKITKQMEQRGWTPEQIKEAFDKGKQIPAINKANNNPATRYVNPSTGQSVVIENKTGEVIHVGGQGFKYGPSSGDIKK